MKCPDNKTLVEFTMKELSNKKINEIILHLNECNKCLAKVDFLYEKYKNCPDTETLCAFARNEIEDVNQQNRLKNHINSCETCSKLYKKAKESWKILLEEPFFDYQELWNELQTIKSMITTALLFKIYLSSKKLAVIRREKVGKSMKEFEIGDSVEIEVKSDMDGYLIIIHRDSDGKISLVFPNKKQRNTEVVKGETKIIRGKVTEPIGKKYFKIIITKGKIFDENVVEKGEIEQLKEIENFVKKIKKLKKDEFRLKTYTYKVKDK